MTNQQYQFIGLINESKPKAFCMNNEKKWFAVYTRPRTEKKVADNLTRRKIETYCPLNRVTRQWSDRRKIIYEPLFTSYVFVNASENELTALRQTDGVINLVYFLNKPAVIRESEINAIKRFLNENTNVKLEKTSVAINDNVRILNGPLMEYEGQVLSVKNNTVRILLPSMGYMMYANVETSNIEVVTKTISSERDLHNPLKIAQ